ncbi:MULTISPECIES: hypothetical protein [unclassified Paenibacillus]|uniref:Uncharacterized protein n=1 Tax=Paenibacillus provencensis TaxID=441151 RepID=A0ABW3PW35_9BACL|nr:MULTISPECIES: hypothetical protein [unclassified Paenibacillus]MCM3127761.1 hypothetical protein [Paenibacillus sp. MER 78]
MMNRNGAGYLYIPIGLVVIFFIVTAEIPSPFIVIGIIFIIVHLLISILVKKQNSSRK